MLFPTFNSRDFLPHARPSSAFVPCRFVLVARTFAKMLAPLSQYRRQSLRNDVRLNLVFSHYFSKGFIASPSASEEGLALEHHAPSFLQASTFSAPAQH